MTIRTIKRSGGDYSTLTGWIASLDQVLDSPQQADIYNFGPNGLIERAGVPFRGFKTTATNKLILNVPPRERHTGVAHSGAYVTNVPGSNGITTMRLGSNLDHFEVHGLEVESRDTRSNAWHWNLECDVDNSFVMDHCIIHGIFFPIWAFARNGNYKYRNTIFYCSTKNYQIIDTRNTNSVELSNCTAYNQGGEFVYICGAEATIVNCYGGGASKEVFASGGKPAGSHNASDDASATKCFSTGSINNVSGAAVFNSVVAGEEDFHLKAGANALVNAGSAISTVTDDIVGTPRPQDSAFDISAFERIAAGGGSLSPRFNTMDVGLGAVLLLPGILARKIDRRSLIKGLWLPRI